MTATAPTATIERRFLASEMDVFTQGGNAVLEGYAAVFGQRSEPLVDKAGRSFFEEVHRSAFNKTLADGADVICALNHDPALLLGRTSSQTLEVAKDSHGLHYRCALPNTSYAHDLAALAERRDLNRSSFAFMAIQDPFRRDNDGTIVRQLKEVRLLDVAPVTHAAYSGASAGVSFRSFDRYLVELRDSGVLIDEHISEESAVDITADSNRTPADADKTIETPASNDATSVDELVAPKLAVARRRLQLLDLNRDAA